MEFIAERSKNKKLNTIYIGGGTPTTLTAEQLERLMEWIDEKFSREHLLEYTVEAGRPDSITEEKLKVIKSHGITRISINPQSMQQKTLDAIGRKHTVEEIKEAYALARETGFDNINMDIIAGLPGEDISDMEDTLAQIAQMKPDSLTVHSLAIKRAARMEMRDLHRDVKETHDILSGMIEKAAKTAEDPHSCVPYPPADAGASSAALPAMPQADPGQSLLRSGYFGRGTAATVLCRAAFPVRTPALQ